VALTILVVNVSNTESIEKISKGEFRLFLPIFFSFIFSFVVIGMYWVAHHNEMNLIQRSDRPFLWLSLLFLLSIVCIPFSAAYLGKNWIWNGHSMKALFWRNARECPILRQFVSGRHSVASTVALCEEAQE
jgi:uncharacterized membrane protein